VSYSNFSNESNVDEQTSVVWFISFGDLLTLLVCFFFVLTPRLVFSRAEDMKKGVLNTDIPVASPNGTAFAYPPLGEMGVVHSQSSGSDFKRADIHALAWREQLAQVWELYRVRAVDRPLDSNIRLCAGGEQQQLAKAMLFEIERSREQLRSWSMELSALCEQDVDQKSSGKQVVAVMEFSGS
jgi:hypothetical protein